jgi:hypothetical protein
MNPLRIVLALAVGLAAAVVPDVASADRGRDRFESRHHIVAHPFKGRHGGFERRRDHVIDNFVRLDRGRIYHDASPLQVRRGHGFRSHGFRGHRHHRHFGSRARLGVFIGAPLFWNWPPPYYGYPPPAVIVPSRPPVYIERDDAAPPTASGAGYWHYCDSPAGYYPYVRECPGGWERVAPTPPR